MLDINIIIEQPDLIKKGMKSKGIDNLGLVDDFLAADSKWRSLLAKTDELRNKSNSNAKEIGVLFENGEKKKAQGVIEENSKLKKQIKNNEDNLKGIKENRDGLLLHIPNLPHETVPVGKSPEDNEIFETWGVPASKDWQIPHWEILENNRWADFERGALVTGAGFPFYLGAFARLQRAL